MVGMEAGSRMVCVREIFVLKLAELAGMLSRRIQLCQSGFLIMELFGLVEEEVAAVGQVVVLRVVGAVVVQEHPLDQEVLVKLQVVSKERFAGHAVEMPQVPPVRRELLPQEVLVAVELTLARQVVLAHVMDKMPKRAGQAASMA